MHTPKGPIVDPMSRRPERPERPIPQAPTCTKTCAPGSELNIERCICVQKAMGKTKDSVFNPQTGGFTEPRPEPSYGPPQGRFNSGGSVIKGSSLRRQASTKGLRTSKKHK